MSASTARFTVDTTAMEAHLRAARAIGRLASDERLARRCVAYLSGEANKIQPPPCGFEQMLSETRQVWAHLASRVLPAAIPFAWDGDATRWVEGLADATLVDLRLTKGTLPKRAWWWFAPGTLTMHPLLRALAWATDDAGVELYPFLHFDEPDPLSTMAVMSVRIEFDEPVDAIERRWAPSAQAGSRLLIRCARFLTTACSAVASGELIARAMPIEGPTRGRLERAYPDHAISASSYTIRRGGLSSRH